MTEVVPFLRVSDAEASADWYRRLGFEVEWRRGFEPGLPLFVAVRREGSRLSLSEHEGDAPPGSLVYLYVDDVDAIAGCLGMRAHDAPWGTRELELADLDRNRLCIGTRPKA